MSTCMKHFGNSGDYTPNSKKSSPFITQSLCSTESLYEKPGKNICCDVIFGSGKRQSAGECCVEDVQLPTEPPPRICVEKLQWRKPVEYESVCELIPGEFHRDNSLKFRCEDNFKACTEITEEKKKLSKFNLGNPVGVSLGSFCLSYLKPSEDHKILQGYATCLIAFGEIFITPEHEWSIIIINKILDEGKQLIESSLMNNTELTEANVTKRYVLCKNTMEIELFEPCFTGKVISDDISIPNLKDSIEKFFIKEKYCMLWIGDYYFLIWKTMGLYFCFDCYGRDPQNLCMDLQSGFASLLCLRKAKNVYHLIANLSSIYPEQMFTMRRIKMSKLLPCCEMAEQIDDHERKIEYEVVNDRYARLSGRLHLGSECFREFRFKQSLAVAVIALVYSKIDATCTWDGYIVDQVLLLGTDFYKRWTFCDHCFDLGIQDIPGKFQIGQFTVEIVVNPIQESGQWQCIPNFRHSALTKAIKRAFQNSANLLLQIERKTYALWRRSSYYYLLDPYEHQSYTGAERTKTSMLHMCSTLNVLCCKLTQVILEIPSSRPFYIHWLKICNIIKTCDMKAADKNEIEASCITKRPVVLNDEVASMNESVVDLRCKKEFHCLLDKGEIQEVPVADLDSPGISETQIIPTYWNVKCKVMGMDELPFTKGSEEESEISEVASGTSVKLEEGEGDEELDEEGDEEDDEDDEDGGGRGKKKGKGKKGGKGKDEVSFGRKKGGSEDEGKAGGGKVSRKGGGGSDKGGKGGKGRRGEGSEVEDGGEGGATRSGRIGEHSAKAHSEDENGGGGGREGKVGKSRKRGGSSDEDGAGGGGGRGSAGGKGGKPSPAKGSTAGAKGGKPSNAGRKSGRDSDAGKSNKRSDSRDSDGGKKGAKGQKTGRESGSDAGATRKSGKGSKPGKAGNDSAASDDGAASGGRKSGKDGKAKGKDGGKDSVQKARKAGEVYLDSATCQPNSYPGYSPVPRNIAVVGSQSGSYESVCNLLKTGFKCADRVLLMTPWGNYVIFKSKESYFLFDGCTCNVQRFRHLDLTTGTAGLLCFEDIHELVNHVLTGKEVQRPPPRDLKNIIDDICNEYCGN